MIPTQLLRDLGYRGAAIALTEDWRSNRHIQATKTRLLCGKPATPEKLLYQDGRFLGYAPNSVAETYGFYGNQRCKECLRRYLRYRLSVAGKLKLRKARALRMMQQGLLQRTKTR